MSISQMFQDFLSNIKVANEEQITLRYQEITCALNKKFRDTESKTSNQLQVGSYGRWTAIKGISDLDMLYIMPPSKWDDYKNGGQGNRIYSIFGQGVTLTASGGGKAGSSGGLYLRNNSIYKLTPIEIRNNKMYLKDNCLYR